QFWYDRLGRLTASQNREQKENVSYSGTANRFSYTKYDALGRMNEVGEKSNPLDDIRNINMLDSTAVKNWLASGSDRQVTKTIYDEPVNALQQAGTSRKRVSASVYLENLLDAEGDSSIYVYDILGNVKTALQHVKALVAVDAANGKKRLDYDYDLISGKTNKVSYQHGRGDQFYYKYLYDADNRVIRSLTSRDQLIWTEDASYNYYLHGPLARMELGQWKVQGIDHAYTLQGWLKGINSDVLDPAKDIGNDGMSGTLFGRVSRDVYAFKLGYYNNDYKPIGGANASALDQSPYQAPGSLAATGNQLFNGNISYTMQALSKINSGATTGYTYGYDQLNRLLEMRQHTVSGSWSNAGIIPAYSESIAYDANGNILKYLRRGANTTGNPLDMDSLTYKYNRGNDGRLVNNRLNHVRDQVSASNYTADIDDQSGDNYQYDYTGNLKRDAAEGIDSIRWTVYGKINRIVKGAAGTVIDYGYDPAGHRTMKKVKVQDTLTTTYYIRDAQGNVLGIYSKKDAAPLAWDEQDLYGSSRIGLWRWDTTVPQAPPVVGSNNHLYDSLLIGSRSYEITNHLGNVVSIISDKKIGHDSSGTVNYYVAEVLSQNDYYPFGMMMPGRKYSAGNGYRYGFNGKENDNEVKGEGSQQDYGMRIYDPRLGKFLSVDPLTRGYPMLTPYQFASNTPIQAIDLDGLEGETYLETKIENGKEVVLRRVIEVDVYVAVSRSAGTNHYLVPQAQDADFREEFSKNLADQYKNGKFKDKDGNKITWRFNITTFDVAETSVAEFRGRLRDQGTGVLTDPQGSPIGSRSVVVQQAHLMDVVMPKDAEAVLPGGEMGDFNGSDLIRMNTQFVDNDDKRHTLAHEFAHFFLRRHPTREVREMGNSAERHDLAGKGVLHYYDIKFTFHESQINPSQNNRMIISAPDRKDLNQANVTEFLKSVIDTGKKPAANNQ
ncbi:MAG TPA: RHS repeat-associated core domain-containing protein, partial [Flavisolibacter sp.]